MPYFASGLFFSLSLNPSLSTLLWANAVVQCSNKLGSASLIGSNVITATKPSCIYNHHTEDLNIERRISYGAGFIVHNGAANRSLSCKKPQRKD